MKRVQPVYRKLGARIGAIRISYGWTQEKLAKKVGLSRTSIVNFEAGRQRILLHDIETFSSTLHMTPKALLKGIWC